MRITTESTGQIASRVASAETPSFAEDSRERNVVRVDRSDSRCLLDGGSDTVGDDIDQNCDDVDGVDGDGDGHASVASGGDDCDDDDDGFVSNACGGCADLDAAPGFPCGPCGDDAYACTEDGEALVCNGATTNSCGGCASLAGVPGEECLPCRAGGCTYRCGSPDSLDCGSCGDGNVGGGEACDDGNTESCDGCELCELHQSLSLAGGGSAVTIVHPEYDVTSFTLEFWMWVPPVLEAGDNTLIFAQDAGVDEPGWLTFQLGEHSRGEVHYAYAGSWGPIPGTFVVDDDGPGRWVHIAITEGEAIGRVWINGSLAAQTAPHEDVEPISGQPLYIGALPHVPRYRRFAGLMDEFRISSTQRYFDTFEPPRRLLADGATVAMWRFDDVDGDVVEDLSGNGYDLRLEPGATLVPDDGYGLFCD